MGSYTRAAAGSQHSLLSRDDGVIVAFGQNRAAQCKVPRLPDGMFYVTLSGGLQHTILLRSDGQLIACGRNQEGQTLAPQLPEGQSFVWPAHLRHCVLSL